MITPKEVEAYFQAIKCPQCQFLLGDTETFDWVPDEGLLCERYSANSWCSQYPDHYGIEIVWDDPKHLILAHEDATMCDTSNYYKLDIVYCRDSSCRTQITISSLDPYGHVDDNSRLDYWMYDGKVFDFSNFNAAKYIARIKTLMLFS
jgi:hypothetical protein